MKLVILDRDGVINRDSDRYIRSPEDWIPIPGSIEGMARLYHGGFRLVIATNQSGLGRGLFSIDDLNAIHRKLYRKLAAQGGQIEAIFFCPHRPEDGCACRKPRPGLLEEIGARLQVDLHGVPVIGDAARDLAAARAVGAQPILVRTGKGAETERRSGRQLAGIPIYEDLARAADALIAALG